MSQELIHAVTFSKHFHMGYNPTAASENLSWAAKGLLDYMISLPKDWKINRKHLASIYKGKKQNNGADAIDSMFQELIEEGYVIYTKQDPTTGKMIHKYEVYPMPHDKFKKMFPEEDNPSVDNPCVEESASILSNKEKPRNKESSQSSECGLSDNEYIKYIKQGTNEIHKVPRSTITACLQSYDTYIINETISRMHDKEIGFPEQYALGIAARVVQEKKEKRVSYKPRGKNVRRNDIQCENQNESDTVEVLKPNPNWWYEQFPELKEHEEKMMKNMKKLEEQKLQ